MSERFTLEPVWQLWDGDATDGSRLEVSRTADGDRIVIRRMRGDDEGGRDRGC